MANWREEKRRYRTENIKVATHKRERGGKREREKVREREREKEREREWRTGEKRKEDIAPKT